MKIEKITSSEYEDLTGWYETDGEFYYVTDKFAPNPAQALRDHLGSGMRIACQSVCPHGVAFHVKPTIPRQEVAKLEICGLTVVVVTENGVPEVHIDTDACDRNGAPLVQVQLGGDSIYESMP